MYVGWADARSVQSALLHICTPGKESETREKYIHTKDSSKYFNLLKTCKCKHMYEKHPFETHFIYLGNKEFTAF